MAPVVQRARVYLPAYGVWSARVSLAGPATLATGARRREVSESQYIVLNWHG